MEIYIEEICELLSNTAKDLSVLPALSKQQREILGLSERFTLLIRTERVQKGNQKFGLIALKHIDHYSIKLNTCSTKFLKFQNKYRKVKLKLLVDKIKFLFDILPSALYMSEDDYSNLPEDHPRKQAIRRVTQTIIEDEKTIKSQITKFMNLYNSARIAMFISASYPPSKLRNLFACWNLLYSYFTPKYQKMILNQCKTESMILTQKLLWNVTHTPLLKKILPCIFEKIQISDFIFIPRTAPLITNTSQFNLHPSTNSLLLTSPTSSYIPILILSPFAIPTKSNQCSTLIIHVHGGGHIGQSTFSHQTYTRRWANSLNMPVFSIEYRLAPENPFPSGPDDVWQAYVWLVNHSESQIGIIPSKVVLVGDSVGGNYIVAITLKAIQCGFRVPDSLLAIYPLLNHSPEIVSLGSFLQLEDQILDYSVFRIMREAHIKEKELMQNFLVSPLLCDEKMFERFPRTRFMVTLDDPLYMDSFRFADRLLEKECDVGIYEYPNFIHGALNFAVSLGIPVFERFYQDSLVLLIELVESN